MPQRRSLASSAPIPILTKRLLDSLAGSTMPKRELDLTPTACYDRPPFIPVPDYPISGPPFPLKPGRISPEVRFLNTSDPNRIRTLYAHSGDKERDIPMSQLRGGRISVRVKFYEGTKVDDAGPTMDIIKLHDPKEGEFQLPLPLGEIIPDIALPLSEIGVPDHAFRHKEHFLGFRKWRVIY